ncbi:MAG: hypothetical protein IKU23_06715 [Clostridia bacterium]|nr:hypothetical protein [Clostridia bacterium]
MKKIIALICLVCLLSTMVVSVYALSLPATKFLENGVEYVAGVLLITTDFIIDTDYYNGGGNFMDVQVNGIECSLYHTTPQEMLESYGCVWYTVFLAADVDELVAMAILESKNGILEVGLNTVEYPSTEAPSLIVGDVNENGKIDARDYLLLKRAYFGTYDLDVPLDIADINGNGKLDARDYLLLKRAYFGTYTITESPEKFSSPFDITLGYADGCSTTVLGYESDFIVSLLNNSKWVVYDVSKEPSDCVFTFGTTKIYYSIASGMLMDKENQKYILLSIEDKIRLNTELEEARNIYS